MAAEQVNVSDDLSLRDYLQGIGGSDLKFVIDRREPKVYMGVKCDGVVGTHSEPPSEEEIEQLYGGQNYMVRVTGKATPGGKSGYLGGKIVKISAEPKLDPVKYPSIARMLNGGHQNGSVPVAAVPMSSAEDPSLSTQAMSEMAASAKSEREARERAEERARESQKLDPAMIEMITGPYKMMQTALENQLAALRTEMAAIHTAAAAALPAEKSTDVFGRLIENNDSRLNTVREVHASELRQRDERHAAELARREASWNDEKKRMEDRFTQDQIVQENAHVREMKTLEKSHENTMKTFETTSALEPQMLKSRINDLERALTKCEAEIGTLRAIKEKSPIDSMREAAEFKQTIDDLTGGGEKEEKEEGTLSQIMQVVAPLVEAVSHRVENAQPQQQPRRRRNPNQIQVSAQPGQPQPQPQQPGQPPQQAQAPQTISLDVAEVRTAVMFMESAVSNGTDPNTFAESSRLMVPGAIIAAIQAYGIERFLTEIGKVPEGSILFSVAGRKFIRRVAQILSGTPAEVAVVPTALAPVAAAAAVPATVDESEGPSEEEDDPDMDGP